MTVNDVVYVKARVPSKGNLPRAQELHKNLYEHIKRANRVKTISTFRPSAARNHTITLSTGPGRAAILPAQSSRSDTRDGYGSISTMKDGSEERDTS